VYLAIPNCGIFAVQKRNRFADRMNETGTSYRESKALTTSEAAMMRVLGRFALF